MKDKIVITEPFDPVYPDRVLGPQDNRFHRILLNGKRVGVMTFEPREIFTVLSFALNASLSPQQRAALLDVALKEADKETGEVRLLNRENLFQEHRAIFERHGFKEQFSELYDDRPGTRYVRAAKVEKKKPAAKMQMSPREAFYYGLPTTPEFSWSAKPATETRSLG